MKEILASVGSVESDQSTVQSHHEGEYLDVVDFCQDGFLTLFAF